MTSTRVFFGILFLSTLILFGLPLLRGDTQVKMYETKVDEGAVVVRVTPIKLFSSDGEAIFNLILDTHNVPLDYDIQAFSTLTDGEENTYQVTTWNGGRGGHHLNGQLRFENVSSQVKTVTLSLSSIDGKDRLFTWTRL